MNTKNAEVHDLSDFEERKFLPDGSIDIWIVIKSQDQIQRRKKLIDQLKRGNIGRMSPRGIAEGLLIKTAFPTPEKYQRDRVKTINSFKEPRGIARIDAGSYLVTEIDRLLFVNEQMEVLRSFEHDYFSFLHTVDIDPEKGRALIVSSGYDSIFEMDLKDGRIVHEWFGWENGFNPDDEGYYLVRDQEDRKLLERYGVPTRSIDPKEYDAHGLLTSGRTTHPSAACYHPEKEGHILAILGKHQGVFEIDLETGKWSKCIKGLERMPHAIRPYENGWIVTNTLKGEFWMLGRELDVKYVYDISSLPGKPEEIEDKEWLQGVFPLKEKGRFIGVDANRGLITFDINTKEYFIQEYDDSWCIQEIMIEQYIKND